jgi:hypothetical protein
MMTDVLYVSQLKSKDYLRCLPAVEQSGSENADIGFGKREGRGYVYVE